MITLTSDEAHASSEHTLSSEEIRSTLRLYAVTDRRWLKPSHTLADAVEQALQGGVTFVQLREKVEMINPRTQQPWSYATNDDLIALASHLRRVCAAHGVPYVVNDFADLAKAVRASGVHIGQQDISCRHAKKLLGTQDIIGVSASSLEEALAAQEAGAHYVGVGAVFPTGTKDDADRVSVSELTQICEALSIPVVAIGGITADNIRKLRGTGIAGVAVVSALFAAPDIMESAKRLRAAIDEVVV